MSETEPPSTPSDPSDLPASFGAVIDLQIEDELKDSYLTYAMSTIMDRALPDVRDGLKPSQRRILVGQSRAGYFVLWSALKEPDLFQARIASNPSVEPARDQLFGTPAAHAREDLDVVVALGAREESHRLRNGADWASAWEQRDEAPWKVKLVVVPDGTHAASIGDAYRRAMLWVFRDRMD